MLAGDPMKRSFGNDKESRAISYACLNYRGPSTPETNGFPNKKCPDGLRAQIFFPSCWDGKNLDSPDHRSHMSYPVDSHEFGPCPLSHPVRFISLFYETIFSTSKFDDMWYGDTQPFLWSMGDPSGYGLHGDFFNGWIREHLQDAIDQCTSNSGNVEDCPVFKLIPEGAAQGCKIPPSIDEQTSGTLDALPGCNPVQAGPERAVSKSSGCTVSDDIGKPKAYFTDLTQTKKWSYVGCGKDSIASRKFTGASTNSKTMTIETCVDFCSGKGFSVAGTEYGSECYCANSIPAEAAPLPGHVGNCMMACAGDPAEYCGGSGTISLYQKCTDTCQNAQFGVVGNVASNVASPAASAESSVGAGIQARSSEIPLLPASTPVDPDSVLSTGDRSTLAPVTASPSGVSVTTEGSYASATTVPDGVVVIPTDAASAGVSPTISGSAVSEATSFPIPSSVPTTNISLPDGWRAGGCYVDPVRPRLLKFWASFSGQQMSSSKCVSYCDEQGFSFAGTENGGQCFCSKDLPADAELKDEGECSTPCKGANEEMCGGPARLSVFTNLSGSDGSSVKRHLHKHRRGHHALLS